MAPSVGDVLRFTVHQTFDVNEYVNVFHYVVQNTAVEDVTNDSVAKAFWDHVKAGWRAFFPADIGPWFNRVVMDNVTDGVSFGEYDIPVGEHAGTRTVTGDVCALWLAVPVRLNVGSHITRPGQKRFGVIYEADASGDVLAAGIKTAAATMANAMIDRVFYGTLDNGHLDPVIYGPVIAPHGTSEGRAVAVTNPIISYTVQPRYTSQRTRRA